MPKSTVPISTSAPGFQMKLRPKISGCRVRMKTPTRHSGRPALTNRSQTSAIACAGFAADLAPPISQSMSFCNSDAFMPTAFASQVATRSRRPELAAHLPAMPEQMIGQHAGHHGFADWHGADADAGIVAAFCHDVGVVAGPVDGLARRQDRR